MVRIDRRLFLTSALALSACGWDLTRHQYAFTLTDEAREPFFAAIRAFAARESYKMIDTSEGDEVDFPSFYLSGWRSQIHVSAYRDYTRRSPEGFTTPVPIRNRFRGSIVSTSNATPWALRGEALDQLGERFVAALSVPGVAVARDIQDY